MYRVFLAIGAVVLALLMSACATPRYAPEMAMSDATINPESVTGHALRWLPGPSQSISVAVYGISDETGAFKPSEGGQTLSRAVTQAPTPILIKALHDAGNRTWFDVIERENLGNLIKERQIIQEMRARYLGETELNTAALPALKFAGVLIEGAITGYDTNTRTGGLGARYLGIGGSTQYREDAVSVYLRLVSVKTGDVLVSITAEQRVASVSLQGDAFRFVSFQKLLEAEAGITLNQPRHMAVRQALEKAVYGLIVEGAELGLWGFDNQAAGIAAIDHYRENYAPYALTSTDGGLPPEFYAAHLQGPTQSAVQLASSNGAPAKGELRLMTQGAQHVQSDAPLAQQMVVATQTQETAPPINQTYQEARRVIANAVLPEDASQTMSADGQRASSLPAVREDLVALMATAGEQPLAQKGLTASEAQASPIASSADGQQVASGGYEKLGADVMIDKTKTVLSAVSLDPSELVSGAANAAASIVLNTTWRQ